MKQNTQNGTYIKRIHYIKNEIETCKTYNHIYNDTQWSQNNIFVIFTITIVLYKGYLIYNKFSPLL